MLVRRDIRNRYSLPLAGASGSCRQQFDVSHRFQAKTLADLCSAVQNDQRWGRTSPALSERNSRLAL